ncbi:hypothetical protein EPD60_10580 [Flaviaesturariibacter flavus]|uniref:Uncharacterized protein n=1 Tax=Flaviaesturariibacter flavus TaxID=2502780 RepID=A0A4R1BBT2_9BACT|nr:hypothetical protein [Flaviaesturariibacter flavus]TCJ14427.1 hypothetical protein EPD60_10580 [Flaviaesturariibacter flavus]
MNHTTKSLDALQEELRHYEARYHHIYSNRQPALELIRVRSRIVGLQKQIARLGEHEIQEHFSSTLQAH